ncbi:MAG: PA2778 family cysteine peptidase [Panacagrimonas sp.]
MWLRVTLASVLLGGCGLAPVRIQAPPEAVELRDVPFFPQTEHHCGPAALATLLGAQALAVTPEQLTPWVYVPGREGSLQAEMISATRRFDRLPLRLPPSPEAMIEALHAGQPVLLLQNLGLRRWPSWHYAVLVGYEPEAGDFVLRSGTEQREVLGARRFLAAWEQADRWAMVAVVPDTVPAWATEQDWLAAAAPFESLGRIEIAERAYRAAVARWPASALAWQGLANARYAARDLAGADDAFRRAVSLDPASVPARNNLVNVLLERGCAAQARTQLEALGEVPAPFADAVRDTRAAVARVAPVDGAGCNAAPAVPPP